MPDTDIVSDDFFAAAGERADALRALDALIRDTIPKLAADRHLMPMGRYDLLSYGMYHYTYASGREGDWPAVGLANQKNYISLYVSCVSDDGNYLAEQYGKRLGKVSCGKSCIRFKKLEDLNLDEIANILRETETWWRAQPKPE